MKHTITLFVTVLALFVFTCKETESKTSDQIIANTEVQTMASDEVAQTSDYSSLLKSYECDMTTAEIANALQVSEADIIPTDIKRNGWCTFQMKGFGQNTLGKDTFIEWGLDPSGNVSIKKEIESYEEAQANNIQGMTIERSENGDCYIAKSPKYGRVVILKENYNKLFFFNYAPKHNYKTRTQEQHDDLGKKMVQLANYLINKHKK